MKDERHRNAGKQLSAYWVEPKKRVYCVEQLGNNPIVPCPPRLVVTLLGANATAYNFKCTSNN